MRSEDYKRRMPLVMTPLRKEFIDKISRLLYHYGDFYGGWQRLERDNLLIFHNSGMMSVDLDGVSIIHLHLSPDDPRRMDWCDNAKLKDAMRKLDLMFVLDDLSSL